LPLSPNPNQLKLKRRKLKRILVKPTSLILEASATFKCATFAS
jgi:hypothetical protein